MKNAAGANPIRGVRLFQILPFVQWRIVPVGAMGLANSKPAFHPQQSLPRVDRGAFRCAAVGGLNAAVAHVVNLTRAKDAVTCFMQTEERRQRGRHSPLGGRLCVKPTLS